MEKILSDYWIEVKAGKGIQTVNGKWYAPKFGCDSLEMTLNDIQSQTKKELEPSIAYCDCGDSLKRTGNKYYCLGCDETYVLKKEEK